jgi:voltage-gated potassium channel
MRVFRHLAAIALALIVVTLIGMAGFHYIEGWSWFDGLYMVITTFSTIGYQEVHPLSHAGRVFNVLLIFTGVSLVFLGIGSLTQALLEFELRNFFGRRKMERDIGRLSDHYIICGAGRVGRSAARELARRPAPFVIVEQNEAKAARFSGDYLVHIGDATQEATLGHVHIERARGLVAATTTDATNLYIVLTARGLNPNLTIIARFRGLALSLCRAAHRAIVSESARRQLPRHRHHAPGHRPGNRRDFCYAGIFFRRQDD